MASNRWGTFPFWVKLGLRAATELGLLFPQQRTNGDCIGMSVSCQNPEVAFSFDPLVGAVSRNTAARGKMILISVNSPGWVSTSIEPLDFGTGWAQA
jgi:hypothetical protein